MMQSPSSPDQRALSAACLNTYWPKRLLTLLVDMTDYYDVRLKNDGVNPTAIRRFPAQSMTAWKQTAC
jgi:hypothetical protein